MCGKLETIWIAYIDGKASEQERTLLEAHLRECAECRQREQDFLAVSRVLGEWEAPEPSPWFDARLRRRIAETPRRPSWLPHFSELFPPVPLGIGALVVLACLLVFSGRQAPVRQPQQAAPVAAAGDASMAEVLRAAEDVDLLNNFDLLSELKKPAPIRQGDRH